MYYTIYRITNLINGKFYLGKHQTKNLDDGYFGSGKILKRAINKYGIENFYKEILFVYDSEAKMNLAEKILVVPDKIISYNLCSGGQGGFGYINKLNIRPNYFNFEENRLKHSKTTLNYLKNNPLEVITRTERLRKYSNEASIKIKEKYPQGIFKDRKHKDSTKILMSEKAKIRTGEKNSQFGTIWITNGKENKKIKALELDNWYKKGFYKGRK